MSGALGSSLIIFGGVSHGKYISAACHVLETDKATVKKMQEEDRKQAERDRSQLKLKAQISRSDGAGPSIPSKNVKKVAKRSLTFLLNAS